MWGTTLQKEGHGLDLLYSWSYVLAFQVPVLAALQIIVFQDNNTMQACWQSKL